MVGGVALAGVVGLGAVGGIIANIALTPLTAGASLLQSYWYGAGLILGERMMYTVHWEKIKARLDKGETFMNVLDAEMNKDITAIAELSFKAMDETGNLFLKQGTANLGKFIEELLAAAINPFFSGTREEEDEVIPPGETTDEGTSYTISQLQEFSINVLQQIIAFPANYTATTVQHAKTILTQKLLDQSNIEEQEETEQEQRDERLVTEIEFAGPLSVAQSDSIVNFWGQFLPQWPPALQDVIVARFRSFGWTATMSLRTLSSASNTSLQNYFQKHALAREDSVRDPTNVTKLYTLLTWNATIAMHQMIYTR